MTKGDENVLNLEKILVEEVGPCGKFQFRVLILCAVLAFNVGLITNNHIFTFAKINTRCMIPECESRSASLLNFTPSWIFNAVPGTQGSLDSCHRYGIKILNASKSCSAEGFDGDSVIECEEYVYEDKNSAIYEFKLACDDWRPNLIGSIKFVGAMLSLPITGFVADLWGRRLALAIGAFSSGCFACLKYWAGSYTSYMVLAFFETLAGGGLFTCIFVLAVEYMELKYRVAAGATMTNFVALGITLQGLIAWTGLYWRYLILIFNAPLLVGIFYPWIAPESVRWLMSKGRFEESKAILKEAAEINGNVLSENTLKSLSEGTKKEKKDMKNSTPSLVCLVFSYKRVLLHSMLTPFWWISCLFVVFGLTISSVGVSGNKYINYIAVTAIEMPGHCLALLLLNRTGRKLLLIAAYWICGACQIAYILVPEGYYWASLLIYLTGKLSITVVVTAIYVYTSELFPTQYRTTFVAYSSMLGRIGAICAPLTPALSALVWEPLPFVLFAGMAFLSGLLVMLAPETLGAALPDTMQEANDLGRGCPSKVLQPFRMIGFRRKKYIIQ